MKLKGKQTVVNFVDVEVNINDIMGEIRKALGFGSDDYVRDGKYYELDGHSFHNGDPDYKSRIATPQEIELWDAYTKVSSAVRKKL